MPSWIAFSAAVLAASAFAGPTLDRVVTKVPGVDKLACIQALTLKLADEARVPRARDLRITSFKRTNQYGAGGYQFKLAEADGDVLEGRIYAQAKVDHQLAQTTCQLSDSCTGRVFEIEREVKFDAKKRACGWTDDSGRDRGPGCDPYADPISAVGCRP